MSDDPTDDQLYWQACDYVTRKGRVRITELQLRFRVGYNQASRWVERMERNGVIPVPRDRLH
jgi:DNA segregation ATPase FtsK/SpoIIIE, S-DNA-T family